jgi:hypothetical protein
LFASLPEERPPDMAGSAPAGHSSAADVGIPAEPDIRAGRARTDSSASREMPRLAGNCVLQRRPRRKAGEPRQAEQKATAGAQQRRRVEFALLPPVSATNFCHHRSQSEGTSTLERPLPAVLQETAKMGPAPHSHDGLLAPEQQQQQQQQRPKSVGDEGATGPTSKTDVITCKAGAPRRQSVGSSQVSIPSQRTTSLTALWSALRRWSIGDDDGEGACCLNSPSPLTKVGSAESGPVPTLFLSHSAYLPTVSLLSLIGIDAPQAAAQMDAQNQFWNITSL